MYDLHLLAEAPIVDVAIGITDADPEDRLMTAATLAATAFRMKDMEGLLYALRALTAAVEDVRQERDAA